MARLVLIRHGQSLWNAQNRFTGWRDIALSERGRDEARRAARMMKARGLHFTIAFTSALARAEETCRIILREMESAAIPIHADAALNERDYGDLTGMNKREVGERYGEAQLHRWRRGFADKPPGGESLKETASRVLPYYEAHILPSLRAGETALIAAHGNSLRALLMRLEALSPDAITRREIATGEALLYDVNEAGEVGPRETLKEKNAPSHKPA